MEAVVLAGGFGTRLRSVVNDVPKPMAPVDGKPFLDYLLLYLKKFGITDVILSVGYLHEVIVERYGELWNGINIKYAIENEPLGTGGGVKLALSKSLHDDVLVLNGDTFFGVDIQKLAKFYHDSSAKVMLALKEVENVARYGKVDLDDENRVVAFHEKGSFDGKGLINGGIYMINKGLLDGFPEKFSFEKDFLEKNLDGSVYGFVSNADFIDIGVPEDYFKIQKWNLNCLA